MKPISLGFNSGSTQLPSKLYQFLRTEMEVERLFLEVVPYKYVLAQH